LGMMGGSWIATMASGMAPTVPGQNSNSGKLKLQWLGALIALTLVAATAGTFLGLYVVSAVKSGLRRETISEPSPSDTKQAYEKNWRKLPPIVANLDEPPNSWVRLEAVIVFDAKAVPKPDLLAAQISQDLLGFLKTLSLAQLAGSSSLQNLRDDLNERASVRSDGAVHELIIQVLVIQ